MTIYTPLTSDQLEKHRQLPQEATLHISIYKPDVLATGTISSPGKGLRSISYASNLFVDTAPQGSTLRYQTYAQPEWDEIRLKTHTDGAIALNENGVNWVGGAKIQILNERKLWPVYSHIADDGTFFKDGDVAYDNDQNLYTNPVPVMGGHKAKILRGATVTFTLAGSQSYVSTSTYYDPYTGTEVVNEIDTYQWEASHGTIGNPTAESTTLTVSETAHVVVKLTVTDTNGRSKSTERIYFVETQSTLPLLDIESLNVSNAGLSFRVDSDEVFPLNSDELPNIRAGALVVLWHEPVYGNSNDPLTMDTDSSVLFCGYVDRFEVDINLGQQTSKVEVFCEGVDLWMDKMIAYPITLDSVEHPQTWYQYHSRLTIGRACHHFIEWHTSIIEICDVLGLNDDLTQIKAAEFQLGSLKAQLDTLAYTNGRFITINSDRYGRLRFYSDYQMLSDGGRSGIPSVSTLTPIDITGDFSLTYRPLRNSYQARVSGVSPEDQPILAVAPNKSPEPLGTNEAQAQRLAIASQSEANTFSGRLLGLENEPVKNGINIIFQGMATWIDVGQLFDLALGVPLLDGRRAVVIDWSINYTMPGLLQTSATLELLTEGFSGIGENIDATLPGLPAGLECVPDGETPGEDTPDPKDDENIKDTLAADLLSSGDYPLQELLNGNWQAKSSTANWVAMDYTFLIGLYDNQDSDEFNFADSMIFYEAVGGSIHRWTKTGGSVDLSVPTFSVFTTPPANQEMVWCHCNLQSPNLLYGVATWVDDSGVSPVFGAGWCYSNDAGVTWRWHALHNEGENFLFLGAWRQYDGFLYVTAWHNFQLKLYECTNSTVNASFSLGACDIEDVQNKIFVAYPYVPLPRVGVVVHGRMPDPFDMGLCHIIYSPADTPGGWQMVENGWDYHYCSAVRLSGVSTTTPIFDAVKAFF